MPNEHRLQFAVDDPLTEDEKRDLLIHLMCTPQLATDAMRLVNDELFDTEDMAHRIAWRCIVYLVREHGIGLMGSALWEDRLFDEIQRLLSDAHDDERTNTSECETLDPLLRSAFETTSDELDFTRGVRLLQLQLQDRYVMSPMREIGRECTFDVLREPDEILNELRRRQAEVMTIGASSNASIANEWDEHEQQLDLYRGRDFIGLRTGLASLDERTLGLRGVGALGAPPNVGKTAYALEIALGVCRHHEENDAVVVFLALDMRKRDIYSRIKANLSDIAYSTLVRGSGEPESSNAFFSQRDQRRLERGRSRMEQEQIGNRLFVVDRAELPEELTANVIHGIVTRAKERVNASRALVIVDYVQILPVPQSALKQSEIEQDRYRIGMLQELVDLSTTAAQPLGDAVLFISETRKPSSSKDRWGDSLSDFMGTARLTYAIDYALLYRRMNDKELESYYGIADFALQEQKDRLDQCGIAPVVVSLEKARDGMRKGSWGMEFHFYKNQHEEIERREQRLIADAPLPDPDAQGMLREMADIGIGSD